MTYIMFLLGSTGPEQEFLCGLWAKKVFYIFKEFLKNQNKNDILGYVKVM